jgi:hypothetical protein
MDGSSRMTLTNRDYAKVTTVRKVQKALFAWKSYNDIAVARGASVLKEQPTYQTSRDVVNRQQGGCKCAQDALENPYEFNGLSSCGCGV